MEKCVKNNSSSDNKNLYFPYLSKEMQADSNSSRLLNNFDKKNNDENVISIGILLGYSTIGFKIVPLGADSKIPAIKSTAEIYNNCTYWVTELIKTEHYRFKNIATTFGKTNIKDEKGEYLCLHGIDIDSENVLRIVFDLLQDLKSKTFVTKTKKDCGYH